jgi:hypothetical protein
VLRLVLECREAVHAFGSRNIRRLYIHHHATVLLLQLIPVGLGDFAVTASIHVKEHQQRTTLEFLLNVASYRFIHISLTRIPLADYVHLFISTPRKWRALMN